MPRAGGGLDGAEFRSGYYYLPTIFTNVTNQMRIAQEEIFGPVVCVISFDSEEEAINLANGTEFGLATSIWTRGLKMLVAHGGGFARRMAIDPERQKGPMIMRTRQLWRSRRSNILLASATLQRSEISDTPFG